LANTDTDTDISVSANGITVSAISVSVLANLDIGYIGIGQILAKIQGYRPKYRPKYRHISAKSQLSAKYRPK
jgi:hypothetical protein